MKSINFIILILLEIFFAGNSFALTADQIAVVVNKNGWHSIELGKYYMKKRAIPEDNILRLWTTDKETVSREDYEKQIVTPVKRFLEKRSKEGREIKCLVLMFGMPLKINPPEFAKQEKEELKDLKVNQENLKKSLAKFDKETAEHQKLTKELKGIQSVIKYIKTNKQSKGASLESELSLVLNPAYKLEKWIENPLFLPLKNRLSILDYKKVLLVSRLDGPSDEIVRRIIDDSIETEKKGLQGTAYFDARYKAPKKDKVKDLKGYGYYDWSIHQTAAFFKDQNIMPTILDDDQKLFQKGEAPNAAIYCGWYSLSNYVDAFTWQPGAVGFHIASGECVSLKRKNNQWCRKILENGAAATIGPVGEPYLQTFPIPELFFKLLAEGQLTLVECYYLSLPVLSWKMVLIGDPLYRPFKNRRQVND